MSLDAAARLVPYLDRLGVSHLYVSPLLCARRGSAHGYDVVDPTRLDPALGDERALARLVARLRRRGMGLVVDIVPNHMAAHQENRAWDDVLRRGPRSPFASWFDVDWAAGPIVLPVLGDSLAHTLARCELTVVDGAEGPRVRYYDRSFPLDPTTWDGAAGARVAMPSARRRPAAADDQSGRGLRFGPGAPARRRLAELLARQSYRLVHWTRAGHAVTYRRFFNVNDLVGVRVEDPRVFAATHARLLAWVHAGLVDAFRIDHIDGLRDPLEYLRRLRRACGRVAVSGRRPGLYVEKVLCEGESLRPEWPVAGTTGYEFIAAVEPLLLAPAGVARLERWYRRVVVPATIRGGYQGVVRASKRWVLSVHLRADVRRLARELVALGRLERRRSLVALDDLVRAIAETLACLDVYRTYVDGRRRRGEPLDHGRLTAAVAEARAGGRVRPAALGRLEAALLARRRGGAERARHDFVRRFQQTSGAAMAKGVEDTALYRWMPLVARNEVGVAPAAALGDALTAFHDANAARALRWPASLVAVSTHDTKRSADVRARLAVLSEIPDEWIARVEEWRRWTRGQKRRVGARVLPDENSEYLLYQTLVGLWPLHARGRPFGTIPPARVMAVLATRVGAYMRKAVREAKLETAWVRPRPRFEAALDAFVAAVLDVDGGPEARRFLAAVDAFVGRIERPGLWNALSRMVLQLTAPGVPDIYQGDELWNFALVDPDNRRPVDFGRRRRLLATLDRRESRLGRLRLCRALVTRPERDALKLFVVRTMLAVRRALPEVFRGGTYEPLEVIGPRAAHVVAFARRAGPEVVVVVAPRLTMALLGGDGGAPICDGTWAGTSLRLPGGLDPRSIRNAFTAENLTVRAAAASERLLPIGSIFACFPVAVLKVKTARSADPRPPTAGMLSPRA